MKLKVLMEVGMPTGPSKYRNCAPIPIEDQVRDALELVDSGYNSKVEWLLVTRLYERLKDMPRTPRVVNLMKMIEPVMAKFGYFENED